MTFFRLRPKILFSFTLTPQPSSLNPQPFTLIPQPSSLNIKPSTHYFAFTLSPEDFRTDTQQDMVKDEASRPFNENLKIRVHPPFPCSPRIYLSPQLFYYQLLTVKLHLRPLISIRFLM